MKTILAWLGSRLSYANVAATVALFLALSWSAYAVSGIPDSAGVFHGCVNRATGVLRIVKSPSACLKPVRVGKHHTAGEFAIRFSQQGPTGMTGQAGVAGPPGARGAQGAQGPPGPSTGPAGGDLTGTYPNPRIATGAVTPAKMAAPAAWQDIVFNLPFDCRWENDSSGTYPDASYYKDALGIVHLRGRVDVQTGSSCFASSVMTVLGASYGPESTEDFATISNGALGWIEVAPDGYIIAEAGSKWVSLDGISWRAAAGP